MIDKLFLFLSFIFIESVVAHMVWRIGAVTLKLSYGLTDLCFNKSSILAIFFILVYGVLTIIFTVMFFGIMWAAYDDCIKSMKNKKSKLN